MYYFLVFWHSIVVMKICCWSIYHLLVGNLFPRVKPMMRILDFFVEIRKRELRKPYGTGKAVSQRHGFSGRSTWFQASVVAQLVKNPPAMQETPVQCLVGKFPWRRDRLPTPEFLGFPGSSDGKESACNAGDLSLIPGLGRSPGGGHGSPLEYFCLENLQWQRSLAGYSPWGCKSQIQLNTVQHNLTPEETLNSKGTRQMSHVWTFSAPWLIILWKWAVPRRSMEAEIFPVSWR